MKNPLRLLLALAVLGLSPAYANPGLDGATGNIFKFDAEKKTFELLKETEYDPKTETARSRFTMHPTEETKVSKIRSQSSFAGLGSQLLIRFEGIDDKNAQPLRERKPFIARTAVVYSGMDAPATPDDGQRRITGRFTPVPGKASISGTFQLKGKPVNVWLRPNVDNITVHTNSVPADLAKGFWQTTIRGE